MEVYPFEREIMFFAKLRCFENLFVRHAEFAIMLTGLRVDMVRHHGDAGEETKPQVNVTLRRFAAKSLALFR